MKFKIGDNIVLGEYCRGFEEATVLVTFIETTGKFQGQQMYLLKIPCGTATIPTSAEVNYKLVRKK